ncbi:DUF916 domain-containing protein [Actinosynnema pretiosum]|uniref:DUF916 domain-containing protein n=1 Tax=Actinosynnema pretiosum TaxID=42197 RepID=UPI001E401868|nr:DUF916 domain-containing protein [Actinosynnema pretiosum]
MYAADAFTTSPGQLDLLPAGTPSERVGTWVSFGQGEVTVQAGQTVPVPFTVSVPTTAIPGDHSGGVVTSLGVADASSGITVDRRLGSRVHVRVGGALAPSLEVRDLTVDCAGSANPVGAGSAKVSYTVVNTDNTRLTATQSVRVEGPFGWLGAGTRRQPRSPSCCPVRARPARPWRASCRPGGSRRRWRWSPWYPAGRRWSPSSGPVMCSRSRGRR